MNTSGSQDSSRSPQFAAQAQQPWQVAQDLDEAHHRQLAGVEPGLAAGVAHGVAANAGELRVGKALVQLSDQAGAEAIAGGFAGDQGDAGIAAGGR